MAINQCDGCIAGHPLVGRIHKAPYPSGDMACQAHRYYENEDELERIVIRAALLSIKGQNLGQKAMDLMGHVVTVEDGYVVKKYADGRYEKLHQL